MSTSFSSSIPSTHLWASLVLPFLDRTDWNAFVLCNKAIYEALQAHYPPWPMNFTLKLSHSFLRNPVWSPNGKQIAFHDSTFIHVWDQKYGHMTSQNSAIGSIIISMCFAPNGMFLVSGDLNGHVKLWKTSEIPYTFWRDWNCEVPQAQADESRPSQRSKVAVSPCSQKVAVLQEKHVLVIQVEDGSVKQTLTLPDNIEPTTNILFSLDGTMLVFGGHYRDDDGFFLRDPAIYCWNYQSCDKANCLTTVTLNIIRGWSDYFRDLALSSDGTMLAAACSDHTVNLWSFPTLQHQKTFTSRKPGFESVSFTPNGRFVVAGAGEDYCDLEFWGIEDSSSNRRITSSWGVTSVIQYSPDGSRILMGGVFSKTILIRTAIDPEVLADKEKERKQQAALPAAAGSRKRQRVFWY